EAITSIPVLGNGDIWSAADAIRMVEETGCDGVVVGRGCLGRPWLFGDLASAFRARAAGQNPLEQVTAAPSLGEVAVAVRRHAELLAEFFEDELHACRDIRKHIAWYFKGYPIGGESRAHLAEVSSLAQLDELLAELGDDPYPGAGVEGPRGRAGSPKRTVLPEGWLDSRELSAAGRGELVEGEADTTGG
ncbi:MAG TPA: tRNA-dihydrouridine synthase, partial [Terrimesophilobacter sp.]|nr:tRNA-dihydrouridine synthase [Terrimesophilobacter sp.]